MNRKSRLLVLSTIAAVIMFWIVLKLIDPSGKIFETIIYRVAYVLACLGGLLLLAVFCQLVMAIFSVLTSLFKKITNKDRTNIFQEMLESLGDILGRAEFVLERKEDDNLQVAEFTRDKLFVELSFEPAEKILRVSARSMPNRAGDQGAYERDFVVECEEQGSDEYDFIVECRDMKKVDHFKRETLARLHEWVVSKEIILP